MKKFMIAGLMAIVPVMPAFAGEIHYQSITDVRGDTLEITDKSPAGETIYHCLTSGACTEEAANTLFSSIPADTTYTKSDDGRHGYQTVLLPYEGTTYTIYIFYRLEGDNATPVDFTLASGATVKSQFSPSGEQFILVMQDGSVKMRDITTQTTYTAKTDQTELPFFIISEDGTYFSTYNYGASVHKILNLKTGALQTVTGSAGYVAFNQSETKAAYSRTPGDFKNLYEVDLGTWVQSPIAQGSFIVEDYLYAGDVLYYMANKATPLSWHLYKLEDGQTSTVDTNVSYGDYIKEVGDAIAYLKTTGKTTDIYLYEDGTKTKLNAAPASPAATLDREEVKISGKTAAILTPTDGEVKDVFIWLHGGPQRQTSLGYHPYLSYAVYDEMMENIAAAGNLVIKLDYTGSWGYGSDMIDAISGQIGKIEMDDTAKAIDWAKKEYDVDDVYVIGNSYGGYMAFQAANVMPRKVDGIVSINGVSNWYSLMSEIPSSIFAPLFGGAPNTSNLQTYLDASVFLNAEDIPDDLPLVTIYGTEDKTIPPKQSTEYATFMEQEGKNVSLTALQGEEHIIRKRSNLNKMCAAIEENLDLSYSICD